MKKRLTGIFLIITMLLSFGSPAFAYGVLALQKTEVTVLMYHLLSEDSADWSDFCISPEQFEDDIVNLMASGYKFLSPQDLAKPAEKGKYALITFDDGYKSDLEKALPILEKYRVPAVFFVITSFIGRDGYLSQEDILKLSKSEYAYIGSHTDRLHNYTPAELNKMFVSRDFEQFIIEDMTRSFEILEGITGERVMCMSYPNGIFSQKLEFLLKAQRPGLITFSSVEEKLSLPCAFMLPLGRYNRSLNFKLP